MAKHRMTEVIAERSLEYRPKRGRSAKNVPAVISAQARRLLMTTKAPK